MVGGELVMIVARMMSRRESSKDGWFSECQGNVCGDEWKR